MPTSVVINVSLGLLAILVGCFMFWTLPFIKATGRISRLPFISIIIPARNEAGRISPLLQSLQKQKYQSFEVIVVDDNSTDDTEVIARSYGAIVLKNNAVESKSGKSMACWLGTQHAKGDWLLFLDADTTLASEYSLMRLMMLYHEKGAKGILSVQPFHTVHKLYENLSAIFNIVIIAGMNVFTFWGNRFRTAGSFGPCILCNKEDYLLTGGHQGIVDAMLDDLALGQAFLNKNLPVRCVGGKGFINFRMYSEGIQSLIEGWCKSFAVGSQSTHPIVLLMSIIWISGSFFSTGTLLAAISNGHVVSILLSGIVYMLFALQTMLFARRCGNFRRWIFLFHPILFLFFTIIHLFSLFSTHILRSVKWRGRNIDLK